MIWLQRMMVRLRALVFRRRMTREFDDELQFHVERQTAENVRRGMSAGDARTAALRAFGGVQRYKEEIGEAHGLYLVDQLRQDLAYAARAARRSPGFTAVVVLTLALGVGATTAIFSVVRGVLLRELPFGSPDRLVRLWLANPARNEARSPISIPDLEDWRRLGHSFDHVSAYSTLPTGLALVDGGEPLRLKTAYVAADFFETLGVSALVGRTILPSEHVDGRDRVVVLAHRFWSTRYGSARDIIGRTLRLNDEPYTVVGVMPPAFRFPDRDTDVWVPISVVPASGIPRTRAVRWLEPIARLAPGVTAARAQSDLSVITDRLASEYGDTNAGWTRATLVPLRDAILGSPRSRVWILFGAVVLTLVLACVNIANLVLARASRRARELAVRTALGAGRARLARQLFTESIALRSAGGAFGVVLATWGVRAPVTLIGPWLPAVGEVRVDGAVLAFALGLSALTGLVFGLIPVMGDGATRGYAAREWSREHRRHSHARVASRARRSRGRPGNDAGRGGWSSREELLASEPGLAGLRRGPDAVPSLTIPASRYATAVGLPARCVSDA